MPIARISYNTNGWNFPSGPEGKSINKGIHESDYGFGFDEWLFNPQFLLTDAKGEVWNYGFIEGIQRNYLPEDENLQLDLSTIDFESKDRFFVAELLKWKRVDSLESFGIIQQNQGLINSMIGKLIYPPINHMNAIGQFMNYVYGLEGKQLFNVKFKTHKYHFDKNKAIRKNNPVYKLNRFWLYRLD